MAIMTSAYANKLLKSLEDDKAFWLNKEAASCYYTASIEEEPVIPDYDYKLVADTIEKIDEKICLIKHAVNVNNTLAKISVGDKIMSVDMILVYMAQLNKRRVTLDEMRKQLPKSRLDSTYFSRKSTAEYRYINYDLDLIKKEYDRISNTIMQMQIALDKYNQTHEFEVAI